MKEKLMELCERFLLHIESNEQKVFKEFPDYLVIPVIPFSQLIYVVNLRHIINFLLVMEEKFSGYLVRDQSYLSIALSEAEYNQEELRRKIIFLLEEMVFK